jgi:hypothetical protein
MATVWFMEKPDVRNGVQWTGDNLAEIEAWAATALPSLLPITDNGDGTITCSGPGWTANITDWVTNLGCFPDSVMDNMQQVSGQPPFSWGIVGS